MEIATSARTLLEHKGRDIWTISPEATVFEAIECMAEKNIGALPVVDSGRLVGILSERDYMSKVAIKGRSSKETAVRDIMVRDVVTVHPGQTVSECMSLVTERRVRHLPVVEDGALLGMVSIGDLVRWTIATQRVTIEQLEKYIAGGY
ncbi:MAG: CBS domain-containing protein [Prosthecobacter sp.]|jgi:CBS domain-containing protein